MATQAPPTPPPAAPVTCPGCGNPAESGQPFCLECGRRLALTYRRPPNWRIPAALIAVLVVAGGVAAGFGVTQLTNDGEGPETITVSTGSDGVAQVDPGEAPPAPAPTPAPAQPQPTTTPPAPAADPAAWPAGEKAFTVVLLITKSKETADGAAQKAAGAGLPAGVLKSDDFKRFEPGLYVVFSGQYQDVDAASDQAKQVSADNPGAYARFVEAK